MHGERAPLARDAVDGDVAAVGTGRPLTEVAALLGHAWLNTTAVYTQPGQADLRRAVEAVDWEE